MINFENRLAKLKDRRQGTKERAIFDNAVAKGQVLSEGLESYSSSRDLREKERYERLTESDAVKYTIGAMAEVSQTSTKVSVSEGERIASGLVDDLQRHGVYTTYHMQGSVALNVHIEGASDVDMLIVRTNPLQTEKPYVYQGVYSPSTDKRSLVDIAKELRLNSETLLVDRHPKVKIDTTKNKSICLEGGTGSLRRTVDIVPATWYDTREYQRSKSKAARGVDIYDKGTHTQPRNFPFLHIHNVDAKDRRYNGNLRCIIRLMKNLVADMPDEKRRKAKKLSSYDLAAIGYHMEESLRAPEYARLSLVDSLKAHLLVLLQTPSYRESLNVPDETRKIFNDPDKVVALEVLYNEVSDLAKAIYKSLVPNSYYQYDADVIKKKQVEW